VASKVEQIGVLTIFLVSQNIQIQAQIQDSPNQFMSFLKDRFLH
jgi:hypothetical protein